MSDFFRFHLCEGSLSFFKSFLHGETIEWIKSKTSWFDSFYRQTFLVVFIISNVVFSFYINHFLFGNHDFRYIQNGVIMEMWYGRYTNALPLKICGGNVSPVLNAILSIAAMTASSMLLCAFFKLPKRKRYWIPVSLLPILLPYVMTWFYYAYETFSHALLPGLAVCALWLVRDRFNLEKLLLSCILVWFTLGIYPSILSFFVLCICGQFIIDLNAGMSLSQLFQRYAKYVGVILVGSVFFKATLLFLRLTGKMTQSIYSLSMPTIPELLSKFFPELVLSFKQFFHPTPYIPISLKLLLFAIIVVSVFLTLMCARGEQSTSSTESSAQLSRQHSVWRWLVICIVWLAMFFSTMLPDYLSKDNFAFVVRTAYFGIPFFVVISSTLVFRFANKVVSNAILLVIMLILWCGAVSDFEIQKNWKIGFQHEMLAYSRVLSMIEQNPEVQALKSPFNYLQVGSLPSGRLQFCRPPVTDGADSLEFHSFEFNPDWSPRAGIVFSYLGTDLKWKYSGSFRVDTLAISKFFDMKSQRWQDFLKKARAYPAPPEQCLFVDPESNSLVVVLNSDVLEKLKNFTVE